MPIINSQQLEQIGFNIIGGFLASLLSLLFFWLCKKVADYIRYKNFKKIFGKDAENGFYIVYGKMVLLPSYDKNGNSIKWPYGKPGTNNLFNISSPVSFTETKSAKYITEAFSRNINSTPKLISDDEIREKLDISYCSLGGYNNFKTIDILESEENEFFYIDLSTVEIVIKNETSKRYKVDGIYDYAVIIKVVPKSFSNRVWIGVAGLGESGTSGATWLLSRNWKKIKKLAKDKQFGLIIRVKAGKDESAEIIYQKVKK